MDEVLARLEDDLVDGSIRGTRVEGLEERLRSAVDGDVVGRRGDVIQVFCSEKTRVLRQTLAVWRRSASAALRCEGYGRGRRMSGGYGGPARCGGAGQERYRNPTICRMVCGLQAQILLH